MIDLDIKEFDTRVFEDFDFNLCRDSLIDFYIEAIKARKHAFSVGLKHSGMYQDWLEQAIEGSYGSHLRYGSPAAGTWSLSSDESAVIDPGIFRFWNSRFHDLYPLVVNEFDRIGPNVCRPKIASIPAGSCLPLHVDAINTNAYHLCVISNPLAFFMVGDQLFRMLPGRWYTLDANIPHTVVNLGNTDIFHVLARDADPGSQDSLSLCHHRELETIQKIFRQFRDYREVLIQEKNLTKIVAYYREYCDRKNIPASLIDQHPLIQKFCQENPV